MGFVGWMFRSRKTGRITLGQLPNWPLTLWLLASVVIWLAHPQGWLRLDSPRPVGWGRGTAWSEPLPPSPRSHHPRLARLLPGQTRLTARPVPTQRKAGFWSGARWRYRAPLQAGMQEQARDRVIC